jgi:TonB family protein
MKHFTAKLFDENRQTRQWSVWADKLTVGSDPRCALVLPAPAPSLAAVLVRDAVVELPFGHLDVVEDTSWKGLLWDSARERISRSRKLGSREPGEELGRARAAVLVGLGVISLAGMIGMYRIGNRTLPPSETALPEVIELVVPEEPKPQPPPPQEPEEVEVVQPLVADQEVEDESNGGSSESRDLAWPPQESAASRLHGLSVLDRINSGENGSIGEDLADDATPNAIDVVLQGNGGHLRHGDRGGQMAGGDGDRMAAVGNIGLGHGGRNGFGEGRASTLGDRMRPGTESGTGTAMRARVAPPKPTDVELGGEAGSRSPESILRVIRTNVGGFQYSYQKHLRDNPNLGGKISLRFTIAPSGDIVQISLVDSNTGDATLDDEIKDKARRMKFDAIEKGNVTVTYAFVLDRQ